MTGLSTDKLISELTDNQEKAIRLKIDYLKDVHSMFAWSVTLPGIILVVLLNSESLLERLSNIEISLIFMTIVVQVTATFLHRVYNGVLIDHLIFRIQQLSIQKTYLLNDPKEFDDGDFFEAAIKINGFDFIKKSQRKMIETLDKEIKISTSLAKSFGSIVLLSTIIYFGTLTYAIWI